MIVIVTSNYDMEVRFDFILMNRKTMRRIPSPLTKMELPI